MQSQIQSIFSVKFSLYTDFDVGTVEAGGCETVRGDPRGECAGGEGRGQGGEEADGGGR